MEMSQASSRPPPGFEKMRKIELDEEDIRMYDGIKHEWNLRVHFTEREDKRKNYRLITATLAIEHDLPILLFGYSQETLLTWSNIIKQYNVPWVSSFTLRDLSDQRLLFNSLILYP